MNYLSVEGLSKRFGERVLFQKVNFGLEQGQKAALIARNGEGKTTFLDILAGKDKGEDGKVVWRKDLRVAYLSQEQSFPPELSIQQALFQEKNQFVEAILAYRKAMETPDAVDQMQHAIDRMDSLQAWDYESKFRQILGVFNLYDLEQKIGELSGGQRKRLALAKVLIEEPDFLILDEPTNHLDVDMIQWLEDYLASDQITLLMVTHDRYFLDRVCNIIYELDRQTLYTYKGNYSYYVEKKAERAEVERSEVEKAKNLFRRELEWVRRMPKARGTKSKSRMDAFDGIADKAKQRSEEKRAELEIKTQRLGSKILEVHHLRKAFGDLKIVDDFSYVFKRGEKVGIVGKNGVGKTTFLNLIMAKEKVDGGKIVVGETVAFGYYTQKGIQLKEDKRVIEVVKDIAEVIPLAKGRKLTASQLLERFLFNRDQQYTFVHKLSGGERRRLYLLTVLMANPNFLILDEPTNDLDIMTLTILEDFLQEFEGCLMLVTHDRYFMDKVADHLFVFEGAGKIKDTNLSYSDWLAEEGAKSKSKDPSPVSEKKEERKREKTKLGYMEKREFKRLEKEIEALEEEKASILEELNSGPTDAERITELSINLNQLEQDLEEKSDRWLELSEWT